MTTTRRILPRDRWVLHFTHIDNLPMILEYGRLVCDTMAQQGLMRAEVGNQDIKLGRDASGNPGFCQTFLVLRIRTEVRMMIEDGHGNLLTADVEALVNTVNTVGVMGKGIALQFKRAYPANLPRLPQRLRPR